MRLLLTIGFSICLLPSLGPQVRAQYVDPDWIEVSPAGESFQVSMPSQPKVEAESVGGISGNRYTALTGIATYTIWSMTNINYRSDQDTDACLDSTAELIWEGLLKSAREKLDDKDRLFARMTYTKELPPEGLPGREYNLTIGDMTGTTEFFVVRRQIYVMLAMGKPGVDWPREKFFASFRTSSTSVASSSPAPLTKPLVTTVVGSGNGESGAEDYNRIFAGREVTTKARVLEKAEPT